ncbi:MAG: transcriptional regulator NrdR [Candidatus Woesearchaeota archaeon]
MKCPFCGNLETRVIDKRETGEFQEITRRRRECERCEKRFTTYEKAEELNLIVIKKDGRKELFDREKILKGLYRAFEKRLITQQQINELVNKIEAELREENEREIPSSKIGAIIMKQLKKIDKVAYIRFVSVYKEFQDIEEFKKALDKL